jgi:membrane protease YdiL (CAAX protease family)
MRGLLKERPAGGQFLLVICIATVSFFIIGLIGTFAISSLSGMKPAEMADLAKWDYSKPSTLFVLRGLQVVQFISLFLIPSLFAAWLFSNNTKNYLGFKKPSSAAFWIMGIVIMVVAFPLSNWLGDLNKQIPFPDEVANWMTRSENEALQTVKALLSKHTVQDLIINIICVAGLAAVGEELLFRGVLQRLLIRMFKSPWAGIIIAAALFSALHMQFYGFFPRLLLGMLLGAVYWYSGSLWVSMLAHFVYDATLIIAAYFMPALLNEEDTAKLSNFAIAGTISFILVVIVIEWMRKRSTTVYHVVYAEDERPQKDHPF